MENMQLMLNKQEIVIMVINRRYYSARIPSHVSVLFGFP